MNDQHYQYHQHYQYIYTYKVLFQQIVMKEFHTYFLVSPLLQSIGNFWLFVMKQIFVSEANLQDPPVRQSVRYLFKKNLVRTTPPKRLDGLS